MQILKSENPFVQSLSFEAHNACWLNTSSLCSPFVQKALTRLFSHPEVQADLERDKIEWKFDLERPPWWGGFFERMVASNGVVKIKHPSTGSPGGG